MVLEPAPHPTGQAPPPPPPRLAHTNHTFQGWGGKKNGWLTYDADIQHQLFALWQRGGGSVTITCAGNAYEVNLVDLTDMTQDRVDTDAPSRRVRIKELSDD